MNFKLQLKRNAAVYADKATAIAGLKAQLVAASSGEPVIAIYTDSDKIKTILGIAVDSENYTIWDSEAIPAEVQTALDKVLADSKEYTDDEFDTINPIVDFIQKKKDGTNYSVSEADLYTITKHTGEKTDVQLTYTPLSPLNLKVPTSTGDIKQGTTAEQLNGKPISEILDSLIFPTIYPTVTNPSATIGFKGFTNGATIEAGSAAPVAATNFTTTLNKGKVHVADGVTADIAYVGNKTSESITMTYTPHAANTNAGTTADGTTETDVTTFHTKLKLGNYSYKTTIGYGAGPVMATSKGAKDNPMTLSDGTTVANPHPAGSVASGNVTLNVSLPIFATTSDVKTVAKQGLVKWSAMTLAPSTAWPETTAADPIVIETPRKINTFHSFNAVSGKFDVNQMSNLTEPTTIQKTFGDTNYTYYQYKWKGGANASVRYQVVTY